MVWMSMGTSQMLRPELQKSDLGLKRNWPRGRPMGISEATIITSLTHQHAIGPADFLVFFRAGAPPAVTVLPQGPCGSFVSSPLLPVDAGWRISPAVSKVEHIEQFTVLSSVSEQPPLGPLTQAVGRSPRESSVERKSTNGVAVDQYPRLRRRS